MSEQTKKDLLEYYVRFIKGNNEYAKFIFWSTLEAAGLEKEFKEVSNELD